MAQDYTEYLAANVLNEAQVVSIVKVDYSKMCADTRQVTYRLLSRAIKVHVNLAKQ
jgi:hypothetical protein